MIALYILSGIAAVFALILSCNISVRVVFDSSAKEDMRVYAKIGFYKIHIIPQKPRKERPEKRKRIRKTKKQVSKTAKSVAETKEEKSWAGKIKDNIPEIFNLIKDMGSMLLKRFKKHLKVKINRLDVILASDEAEKTALLYGTAIQSAYYLHEFLDYNFKIYVKPNKIKIIPDFSKNQTEFNIDVKFYIRIGHALALGIASGLRFLKFWNKTKEKINI